MGHQRMGDIPTSQKWVNVVEKIAMVSAGAGGRGASSGGGGGGAAGGTGGGDPLIVNQIAKTILEAAEGGLIAAVNDPGLQSTFYLLTQLVLSAREEDWQGSLDKIGIKLDADATVFDLTAEVQRLIDGDLSRRGRPTTIGEIARQAAGEAIADVTRDEMISLFGTDHDDLKRAVKMMSTKAGFSDLCQSFFGNFTARFLDSYASRIVPGMAGSPAFETVQDFADFRESLFRHCHESARIVHDFGGEWFSKAQWQQGINRKNANGFIAVALEKMRQELKRQREAT